MRRLREEAQEKARRGEGRKAAAEGQGREKGAQKSREAGGEGQGKAGAKAGAEAEAKAQRQGQRQAHERARRKIRRGRNDCRKIRDFCESRGRAASGNRRFGLAALVGVMAVIARSNATRQSRCHYMPLWIASLAVAMTISSRERAAAFAQADILQLGEGADRNRLRRDKDFPRQIRRHRAGEQ